MKIIGLTEAHECVSNAIHEDRHLTPIDYTIDSGVKALFSSPEAHPSRCSHFAENTIMTRQVTECLEYFYIVMTSRFWQMTCKDYLEWTGS
jgi:hypothetical protein